MTAYDQYVQWTQNSPPPGSQWNWKPRVPQLSSGPQLSYSSPLWGNAEFFGWSNDEPFGFVATQIGDPSTVYVAFRGTSSEVDAWDDSDIILTPYSLVSNFGNVHSGFYSLYATAPVSSGGQNPLNIFLLNLIESYYGLPGNPPRPLKIYLTGHSLGSALCTLAIPDIVYNANVEVERLVMYNFASPRVGDVAFASSMNQKFPTKNLSPELFRIVNTEDIVPAIPAADEYSYEHVGTPVSFTGLYPSLYYNHSMEYSYLYAIKNPMQPQGPQPCGAAQLAASATGAPEVARGRLYLPKDVFTSK
ncbi:MAG TPA: lipase family protein [Blastocatellia bacterium]